MDSIIGAITAISRCGRRYRADALEPLGLKGCHGRYLREISRNPGMSQEQLTESLQVNKSNVARQVAALEEAGFLERRGCGKDKRVLRLYPTQKTLALLPRIEEILDTWDRTLLQDLSSQERELLAQLLGKIRQRAMDAVTED